jgi:hypothetical protein
MWVNNLTKLKVYPDSRGADCGNKKMKSAFCGARPIDRAIWEAAFSRSLAEPPKKSILQIESSSRWPEAVVVLGLALSAGWTFLLGYGLVRLIGRVF